ncbi:MAG: response regulator [Planctomycetota bacterium]
MATLLVVEDNENLCALYQSELEEEGHEVMVAHDGKSGLEKALEERPDLVIMDISLPEKMDGLEAMSRLLGRNSSIPVII